MLQWIHGLRNLCFTSLACLFSDWTRFSRKLGRSEPRRCRQPPTLSLYYKGKVKKTIFLKLRVRIKDNNNSPHGKLSRFLFPFSSKFFDLNFVFLYIPCYITWHTVRLGYLRVTYGPTLWSPRSPLQTCPVRLIMVLCLPSRNRFTSCRLWPCLHWKTVPRWRLDTWRLSAKYGTNLGLNGTKEAQQKHFWRISFTRFPAIALYRPRTFSFALFLGSLLPYCVVYCRRHSSR